MIIPEACGQAGSANASLRHWATDTEAQSVRTAANHFGEKDTAESASAQHPGVSDTAPHWP